MTFADYRGAWVDFWKDTESYWKLEGKMKDWYFYFLLCIAKLVEKEEWICSHQDNKSPDFSDSLS